MTTDPDDDDRESRCALCGEPLPVEVTVLSTFEESTGLIHELLVHDECYEQFRAFMLSRGATPMHPDELTGSN